MEELIILNAEDREKLKGLFFGLITESNPYKQFDYLWQMEEMLLTEEDIDEITDAMKGMVRIPREAENGEHNN